MLPIGPLMIEHRLIERMIQVMGVLLEGIHTEKKVDPAKIEKVIHFVRAYADHCHHGKEEGILFRELNTKNLSEEHRRILEELVREHELGREITASLAESGRRYQDGETEDLSTIAEGLRLLVEFYPKHIEKEDKHFFIPIMDYFSSKEKEAMIRKGYEFDSRLLHQQYTDLVKSLEVTE